MKTGLQFDLIPQQIFELIPFADQLCLPVFYQDLGGFETGIEIGRHFEAIGAGISKYQVVAFSDLANRAVPGKGVRLADISYNGVWLPGPMWVADIFDLVIRVVEHGADQVIETAVHTDKGGSPRLFYHVHLRNEITAFAYEEFSRFEPYL